MNDKPYRGARFRRALIHFVCGRAAQAAGRALLLLVLVRLLEVADYGAYMLIIGLAETVLQVASFGILPVGQRYLPELITSVSAGKLFTFVRVLVLSQIGVLLIVVVALWQLWSAITPHMGFSETQTVATQAAVSLFLLIPAFRFSAEMLDALLEQGKAQIARALMPLARLAGIGVLWLTEAEINISNILAVDICVTLFCLLLSWLFLQKSLKNLHAEDADGSLPVREMLSFGWQMAIVGLMGATGSPGALRLVLANAIGVVESGLFAFLQSLQRLVGRYLPGTLLRGLIRPVLIARAYDTGGMTVLQAGTGLLLKCNLLMVATGCILIGVGGDELVAWLSGGKFLNAGLTLLLMFIALAITSQRTVIEMVMQITGHTKILRLTSYIMPLALFGVWIFADQGLNTAVIIIAVAAAISNWLAMFGLINKTKGFRIHWRGLFATIIPAGIGLAVGIVMGDVLNPIAAVILALPTFFLLVRVARPFNQQELALVERSAGHRAGQLMKNFSGS